MHKGLLCSLHMYSDISCITSEVYAQNITLQPREVCDLRARAVGLMPHSLARLTYACTAAVTLGRGPYLDSASAYLPLYLFKRASFGPPSAARYFPYTLHRQSFDHRRTAACLPLPCALLELPQKQAAAPTQA